INGVKVVGNCSQIPYFADKYRIDQIIFCIPSATKTRQKEIIDLCMQTDCTIKISPSIEEMYDETSSHRIRNVDISDLLSRPEVKLDKKVCRYLIGETVLVTGGGGSIGAELCAQVARYSPKAIIIFDIYENCAFELQNELKDRYGDVIDIDVRIGSVRDIDRLREVFEEYRPGVVFHAAAHKHVPLMEDSPCEAVKNNVFGTYNVALMCDEFKVKKMVILSTDKAVNPTNVMGCTKRICEVIVQHMEEVSKNTEYVAVRFGNVLGSHGSVIPIFKKQIEQGGPVKVTHPDITRYFMTIPEAAQLVCQAGGLAKGGEVFVLDMGEPVKIVDLARNLIRLSGFTEDEIPIEFVGLRPGEKLYEELSMDSEIETRERTANEKIFVNQPMEIDVNKFNSMMKALENINNDNVREVLTQFISTYHPSEN
ncbi:MAG: polysaccharide biosynthesis protein, partial [Eubacterium sp.]|nr:polysaccharide biosynthesis protein [Eubacterium sp.]